ncbi:MAG: M23 family metallopeptidase [Okeania sp. SIO3I5]|uniref:M23 family metallopeptidase n=1 Tax=Okeania sp. SIO3I5 TaxID=2607805 RepID=UPI0013B63740|nr:M23 family metallopeptidase [Okeania sp. SIO3I5]NEQ39406.1 M23 family metallopeptidase [Okeania sp. SIO3I5]
MFLSFKIKQFIPSFILATVTAVFVITIPGLSQTVQVTPTNLQLGDTLSVVIQQANRNLSTPTVSMDGKTYPSFSIGQNRFRALLPTTPLDKSGLRQLQVTTDTGTQNLSVNLQNRSFPTQSIWLPPDKKSLQGTDLEFDRVGAFKQIVTPKKFWNGPFLRPNQGPVSTVYGVRRYYNGDFAENYYHRGVDYADYNGAPVVAPAAGRISLVGLESQGFEIHGNTVGLDHGQGVTSIFIHLSRINVREGDMVKAGDQIGTVGSTGASTGPHLHWGLYVHGQAVDPVPWRYNGIE